ncbi:MAG: MBL fold metallo-hydrolase [Bacteroidia bacterium]|nr:MBL fold metallo-hydrolase [Bacteroidia bacterium]MCF8425971.1 MBL fold metallo-hydrolase [Bacteroidia bacterium]
MYVEQIYTKCLAEAAYYIESNGEAAIIDPLRETEPYIEMAEKRGAKIKYVFETHFHADFVSGHIDLARKTGAQIVYGPTAEAGYDIYVGEDEEVFSVGDITLKLMHTPGHTLESMCLLLSDEKGNPNAVFTGDTVFVGDVGRPDLAVKSALTQDDLAGLLFDSIQKKIKPLADDVIIYPAHGAGSACGKNIGKETQTTIGEQKKSNYAFTITSREEFIKAVTDGLEEPPKYFFMDAAINKNGYDDIDAVMARNTIGLDPNEFEAEVKKGAIILDARDAEIFEKGFIPGSINIGLNGQYAVWVGSLIDHATPILVVTDEGKENEAVLRLARVGYEHVYGFLKGGFEAWLVKGKHIELVESIEPVQMLGIDHHTIIDVRNASEWHGGVLEGAELIPLSKLEAQLTNLDKEQKYLIHCAGGYRSMMATSLMKKHGFLHVKNVRGGINKIKESGFMLVIPA